MIADDATGKRLVVYQVAAAALADKVDWTTTPRTYVDRPIGNGTKFLSAIYVQDPSKQLAPVDSAEFAICGNYPEQDNNIWAFPEKASPAAAP